MPGGFRGENGQEISDVNVKLNYGGYGTLELLVDPDAGSDKEDADSQLEPVELMKNLDEAREVRRLDDVKKDEGQGDDDEGEDEIDEEVDENEEEENDN